MDHAKMDKFGEIAGMDSNSINSRGISYFLKELVDRILAGKISQDTACSCIEDISSEVSLMLNKYSEQSPCGCVGISSSFLGALELLSRACEILLDKLNSPPPYIPSDWEDAREMIVVSDALITYIVNTVNQRENELRKEIHG